MNTLFIGYVIERDALSQFPAASPAGNNFQLGFIESWKKQGTMEVVSVLPLAGWPAGRCMEVFRKRKALSRTISDYLPYLNIRFIKEISIMLSTCYAIAKFCKKNKGETLIISYNGNAQISKPILWLQKKYGYKYMCLVVDPPLYNGTTVRKGKVWEKLYAAQARSFASAAKKCDYCIVLNKYYAEKYLDRRDYYVLDCGISDSIKQNEVEDKEISLWQKDEKKHLVFTGMLHEHSGILKFVKWFLELDEKDFVLHIFGRGIFEQEIEMIANSNPQIIYHGFFDNKYMSAIQRKADLLICPNSIEHPINKVAFPSKIQEYMLSGVPVIATRVNGLSEDYYNHLYLYEDTMESLQKAFKRIRDDGEEVRVAKGLEARQFILREKNWDAQIDKLIKYLSEV